MCVNEYEKKSIKASRTTKRNNRLKINSESHTQLSCISFIGIYIGRISRGSFFPFQPKRRESESLNAYICESFALYLCNCDWIWWCAWPFNQYNSWHVCCKIGTWKPTSSLSLAVEYVVCGTKSTDRTHQYTTTNTCTQLPFSHFNSF